MPVIGISVAALARAIAPALFCAAGMMLFVLGADRWLSEIGTPLRLIALIGLGGLVYAGMVMVVARSTVLEILRLFVRRAVA